MINAVIFDLSGVLFTEGLKKFAGEVCEKYPNLNYDLFLDEFVSGEIGTLYRTGKIDADEFWGKMIDQYRLTEDKKILNDWWIKCYVLVNETRDLILDIKQKYKVYYLSDSVKERVEDLRVRYDFEKWFDGGIFSHEVGVRKPNPQVYKIILQKFNLIPEETIFIDDKEKNLVPAREIGMKTILFENAEELRKELNNVLPFVIANAAKQSA
jgi:epoxide hydrolase-like predicted phosphatase